MNTRTLCLTGFLTLAFFSSIAQSPLLAGEMVTFEDSLGNETSGYLAKPQSDSPSAAVLVIHEWWGLTDWVKNQANTLADQGYVALAVDLYDGRSTDDPSEAHELMRALDQGEAIHDLKGAITYLQGLESVDGTRLGAIGWCMGGLYSRLAAQNSDKIGPTVICYGSVTTDPQQIENLAGSNRPILGIFGALDRGIPVTNVRDFADALENAGSKVQIRVYEDAGHAFMRPGGSQYVENAAKSAQREIQDFFTTHLGQE